MEIKDRIKKLADAKGMSVAELQAAIGKSNAYFQNTARPSAKVLQAIKAKFPDVNTDWILTGNGSMLTSGRESERTEVNQIPLLPISAQGGRLTDFEEQVRDYDCEMIISPIRDAQLALSVTGDSMSPEYPSGCRVLVRKINERAFIEWGRTYVLDTVNGTVIKNIYPCKENDDRIICRSVNPNYTDFEVDKTDIRGWYRVLMEISLK
ncbi:MAG: LexA family transcriptional regulator [Prevotella sp.]|nr:LexA family transcriptional regulator [Prevotella sp.]